MRFALLFLVALACIGSLSAQEAPCKDLSIHDTRLPVYPPIARAAHLEGTIRFNIHLSESGAADVKYLDGPNKGVIGILLSSAREYATSRQHGWITGGHHDACNYILGVEYKIVGPEVDSPNNFLRVTVLDEAHTVVEVKPTTPTVNY